MRKLFLITFFTSLFSIYSQEKYEKLPFAEKTCPTYIFNNNVIGSEKVLGDVYKGIEDLKKEVNEISVLKEKPDRENDLYNLSSQGIILVDIKQDVESKSQSELNSFFGLKLKNDVYIDGYLITNKAYKIALKSIASIELVELSNENELNNSVLNVWTLSKEERKYKSINGCSLSKGEQD